MKGRAADLKRIAGAGEVVGIGSRYHAGALGTVRCASEKAEKADPYPLGTGLVRVRRGTDYAPIHDLVTLPAPTTPVDGATVTLGDVRVKPEP